MEYPSASRLKRNSPKHKRVPLYLQDLVDMGTTVELAQSSIESSSNKIISNPFIENSGVEDKMIWFRSTIGESNLEASLDATDCRADHVELSDGTFVESRDQCYKTFPSAKSALIYENNYLLVMAGFAAVLVYVLYILVSSFRTERGWDHFNFFESLAELNTLYARNHFITSRWNIKWLISKLTYTNTCDQPVNKFGKRRGKRRKKKKKKKKSWDTIACNPDSEKYSPDQIGSKKSMSQEDVDDLEVKESYPNGEIKVEENENILPDREVSRNDLGYKVDLKKTDNSSPQKVINGNDTSNHDVIVKHEDNFLEINSFEGNMDCVVRRLDQTLSKVECVKHETTHVVEDSQLSNVCFATPQKKAINDIVPHFHHDADNPFLSPMTDTSHRDLQRQLTNQYIEDHGLDASKAAEIAIKTVNGLRIKAWELQHQCEIEAVRFQTVESLKDKRHQEKLESLKGVSYNQCPVQIG